MRSRPVAFAVLGAALILAVPSAPAASQDAAITRAQPRLSSEPLSIKTATRTLRFLVEVARTRQQQAAGLMFRRSVPPKGGMIFPMRPVQVATFWMHDTIIPLDMLFIRADGTIARITTAKAMDESIDDSGEPVAAVLELGAGRARALGIETGDVVHWQGLTQ